MVVYIGIFQGPWKGIFLAFLLGYIMDVLSGSIVGLYAFLRILTFLFTKLACENFYLKSAPSQIILTTLLCIVDGLFLLSIIYIFSSVENLWVFVLKFLLFQSVLTGLFGPPIFFLLKKTALVFEPL